MYVCMYVCMFGGIFFILIKYEDLKCSMQSYYFQVCCKHIKRKIRVNNYNRQVIYGLEYTEMKIAGPVSIWASIGRLFITTY